MGKYYVKSGTLEVIVSKKNAFEAAISGLLLTNKFDDPKTNVIATKSIVRGAGWELSRGDD